jgi:predicted GIY-YIG superfamily endonuclease
MHVASVPEQEGVYELADSSRATIYIGQSSDLNRRLLALLNTDDPFWRHAANFRYELTSQSEQRKRELLDEYHQKHERYPPCN